MKIAMIPVRSGSKRLARKNYLNLNGKTILQRAIEKSRLSECFDRIIVNTDDFELKNFIEEMGADFHLRDKIFASDNATSDQVVLDFFTKTNAKSIYWINTVCPFSTVDDIKLAVSLLETSNVNSITTINKKYVHATIENKCSNFSFKDEGFAKTQDLQPIILHNYAIMGWKSEAIPTLKKRFLFTEETLLVESSEESSWLLKTQSDFDRLERISKGFDNEF